MSGAIRPVAQGLDPRRRSRPAERAERLVDERPADEERVIHQVASDLVARVGGVRHQQQLGVLDGVGGEHVALGGDRAGDGDRKRVAGPGQVVDPGHLAGGAENDLVGDRLVDDPRARRRPPRRASSAPSTSPGPDRPECNWRCPRSAARSPDCRQLRRVCNRHRCRTPRWACCCVRRGRARRRSRRCRRRWRLEIRRAARRANGRGRTSAPCASGTRSQVGTAARHALGPRRRRRRRSRTPLARTTVPARRSRSASRRRRRTDGAARSRPEASGSSARTSATWSRRGCVDSRCRTGSDPSARSSRRCPAARLASAAGCRARWETARPGCSATPSWALSPARRGTGGCCPDSPPR